MNYKILVDNGNPKVKSQPLVQFTRDTFMRPVVGNLIEYKKKLYRVTACSPSNNPDNQTVTYTVKPDNPDAPYRRGQVLLKRGYNSGVEQLPAMD
jgi:hypothetical protein